MNVIEISQVAAMSVPEKIIFLEDLWDSIATDDRAIPVPTSHLQELNARLARQETDSAMLLSLPELQQKVASRI